jgi:hypothetical protein
MMIVNIMMWCQLILCIVIIILLFISYSKNVDTSNKIDNIQEIPFTFDENILQPLLPISVPTLPREFSSNVSLSFLNTNESSDHSLINNVIFINLPESSDRLVNIKKEIKRVFGNINVFRLQGVKEGEKGVGILKSHVSCLQFAKVLNSTTLILEDDFEFIEDKSLIENYFVEIKELIKHKKVDVFMLSPYPHIWGKIVNEKNEFLRFMKVTYATTASAYIVFPHYLDTIIEYYKNVLHKLERIDFYNEMYNDQSWRILQEKDFWVCPTKPLGNQVNGNTTFGEYADNRVFISDDLKFVMNDKNENIKSIILTEPTIIYT